MYLELDHLKKHFDGREVVRDLSLTLEQGQLLCILGASGCGKTTTLNMIGGFLEPDSGSAGLFRQRQRTESAVSGESYRDEPAMAEYALGIGTDAFVYTGDGSGNAAV